MFRVKVKFFQLRTLKYSFGVSGQFCPIFLEEKPGNSTFESKQSVFPGFPQEIYEQN